VIASVLDQVDELIRAVLLRDVPELTSADQIRFQPPDDDWRTAVANLGRNAVSIYLLDLRENRALRDHEWHVVFESDGPKREVGPLRVDAHYLISAWSPAAVTPAIEPTLDEHALLYHVLAALTNADPLNPTGVYPPGSAALAAVDPLIRDADLPVQIVPAEGWPKLAEFWGAMGANGRWKPALWFTVTVPVAMTRQIAGPLVTTRIIEFRQGSNPATAERWLQIGGTVTDAAGHPVSNVAVKITSGPNATVGSTTTGDDGRFTVGALHVDGYDITATKPGVGAAEDNTAIPSPAGGYDLTLT
jgi:hypothetical protein